MDETSQGLSKTDSFKHLILHVTVDLLFSVVV